MRLKESRLVGRQPPELSQFRRHDLGGETNVRGGRVGELALGALPAIDGTWLGIIDDSLDRLGQGPGKPTPAILPVAKHLDSNLALHF